MNKRTTASKKNSRLALTAGWGERHFIGGAGICLSSGLAISAKDSLATSSGNRETIRGEAATQHGTRSTRLHELGVAIEKEQVSARTAFDVGMQLKGPSGNGISRQHDQPGLHCLTSDL